MNEAIIEFRDVHKFFGKSHILKGLSLKIPKGKISFIIGKSGEGKSVVLKHIIGNLRYNSGDILINGHSMTNASLTDWTSIRRKVGFLFQGVALFDSMNVFENIAFPIVNCLNLKASQVKFQVKELLSLVDLNGYEKRFPSDLSIGERKLVGLARALALKPKLLLYDEPTTSMDPLVSDLIDNFIKSMQQTIEDLTSVVVSHDATSVLRIADRVFLLSHGKLLSEDTKDALVGKKNSVIMQFLSGNNV